MIVIVAYDISREEVRARLRRFLVRMGLSIINRSVYAGVGGRRLAERIAEKAKSIIKPGDHVFIIVVREEEYFGAYTVTSMDIETVGGKGYELP
ncbi:MAG: CRISPR-associated endonuclease Cas2 [Fervidicoccaceae archaeon]